jgi:hypothetical protein
MKIDFEQIYEGWKNHLFPSQHLKKAIITISRERLLVCRSCEYNSKNKKGFILRMYEHCTDCGCPLKAKTKCLSCCCSLDEPKWICLITEEQEEEINNEKNK